MKIKNRLTLSASAVALLALAPFAANAAGFQLNEQSAAEVGMANAGTAVAPDASVQFFNPAGIAALSGFNFLGGGQIIVTSVNFKNQGSTSLLGTPVGGDASGDSDRGVPEGYVSYQIDDRFTAGLAIYTPFGLATTYPDRSPVRYFSESTSLNTIEINPNIAFRLSDKLSFGAGPAIRYTHANLSTGIDDGGIATGIAASRGLPPAFAAAVGGPEANDARFDAAGDDWDVGYKLGALFQPDKATSIGIAYHSAMESTIAGNATVDNSSVASLGGRGVAALGPQSSGAHAKIDYPDYVTLSGSRQLDDQFKLNGDFEWTNWSRLKNLVVTFDNGQTPVTEGFNWQDSYRFAVGGEYKATEDLTLRAGTAYEISPVGNATERSPRDPDSDRYWISGGIGYKLDQNIGFDFGYSHLFARDAQTSRSSPTAGTLTGEFENDSADIISADVTLHY